MLFRSALTHEDEKQPNTPLSVCVAMSQAYIGYDLQNALREELLNRGITDIPVATMITQVRVDENDPAFENPSKPIGRFLTKEQADEMAEKYNYIMKEDAGRGYRRVVASPDPAEIIEIGTIRTMVESGDLVNACGGGALNGFDGRILIQGSDGDTVDLVLDIGVNGLGFFCLILIAVELSVVCTGLGCCGLIARAYHTHELILEIDHAGHLDLCAVGTCSGVVGLSA